MTLRAGLRITVVAAAIIVLAGCGAEAGQRHKASTWASSYCSALTDWLTNVDAISRGLVQPDQAVPQDITDLETIAKQVSQAGRNLNDALSRAGRPETAGASKVERSIARLSASVTAHSNAASRAAKSRSRSALAGFRRLQAFTAEVTGSLDTVLAADAKIRKEDPDLARALQSSGACRDFHSDVKNGTRRGNE